MADGVLMIFNVGKFKNVRILLITPVFSRRVCHARVLNKKFINIARIKINTIKLDRLTPSVAKIIARGYASNRHIIVLIHASITESPKAFQLVLSEIPIMLSRVKLPLFSVKA